MKDDAAIDTLRRMVRFYSYQNETFNQQFTIEELHKLFVYCMESERAYRELDEFPDTWPQDEITTALQWDGKTGRREGV